MTFAINYRLLDQVVELCQRAGDQILAIYDRQQGFFVATKTEQSPVTEADLAANVCLLQGLSVLTRRIPILSEESGLPNFQERQQWTRYWLVDPLDGTKEFISGNGEFTVNVALIDNGIPVLGVVHVPVLGVTYTGLVDKEARKLTRGGGEALSVRSLSSRIDQGLPIEVVTSRHHGAYGVGKLCQRIGSEFGVVETKRVGSSLKFCMVAAGEADLYPRLGPTSEWDTAAAQAVVEAAGGVVVDSDFQPLRYNQQNSILNPDFFVIGDALESWQSILI